MVFLGAIMTGNNLRQTPFGLAGLGSFTWMIITVLAIHTAMFLVGFKTSTRGGLARPDAIAVGFAGCQKTLIVGLSMAVDAGGSILPMISYHVGQFLVDTLIAERLKRNSEDSEESESTLDPPEVR